MSYEADITIIGAGAVGLAIAAELARHRKDILVLEKNESFGRETSSRHSGVIHSGIFYPQGSLKAKLCVAGNRKLYRLCQRYGIGHDRLGKLIVAVSKDELPELESLYKKGVANGAESLRLISKREVNALEPYVSAIAALWSPDTGIIDSYALMQCYEVQAVSNGAQIAFKTQVVGTERVASGYKVAVEDESGTFSFASRVLINCAGLYSDKVAEMAGIDVDRAGYRLHYCKGEYFSVSGGKNRLVKRLIYPVPPESTGVGIHVTLDLDGSMKLGPDAYYVDEIDYTVDSRHKQTFYEAVKRFLPQLEPDDLEPDMAGIRPKLQAPGEDFRDFVIREESDKGLPGFINLIGIESPGITASPAIAEYVSGMVKELLG